MDGHHDRIIKIEKELAVMANTQATMASSLDKLAKGMDTLIELNTSTKLLKQECDALHDRVNIVEKDVDEIKEIPAKLFMRALYSAIAIIVGWFLVRK